MIQSPPHTILRRLDENFEKPVIVLCLLVALFLIPYQVFTRYILGTWLHFNVDTSMVEELSLFCFITAIYFGASLSIRRRKSLRMTAIMELVPERWKNLVLMFNDCTFLVLTCLIAYLSTNMMQAQLRLPQVTPTLRMPYLVHYTVLFVGFLLMSIRLVQDLYKLTRESGFGQLLAAVAATALMAAPIVTRADLGVTFILASVLAVCMIFGVPIAAALGLAGAGAIYSTGYLSLNVAAQQSFTSLDSFPMLAIFFFIAAGVFMGRGGLSADLFNLADKLTGGRTGGLALTTIVACTLFGAISGSALATVAAIGMIVVPSMVERGYSRPFAGALIACAGTIGAMIPPSNPFVLYGIITNVSIGKLFMGGIVPGLLTALLLMIVAWWISRKNGWGGKAEQHTWGEIFTCIWRAKWALMVPVIILGGIYGGIMTATEASAVAALYGLLVGIFVLRGINRHNIISILVECVVMCAAVMLIVAMAHIFGYVMAIEQIPDHFARMLLDITSNRTLMLLMVNAFLLIVGALMDPIVATIILAPILVPVMQQVGVSPLHFGIILTCNLCVGFVTPPIGSCLYAASSITEERSELIARAALPFLVAMLVMLLIVSFVPELTLYLTRFV